MGFFSRLTVGQSMALIFCAGLSVAVIFASASLLGDLSDRRALAQDRGLLAGNQAIGAVVHELQRERALTSAWLGAPLDALSARIEAQRARTDAVLERAAAEVSDLRAVPEVEGPPLAERLARLRDEADARAVSAGPYSDAMSAETERLIWSVARSATEADSGRVALLTNNLASLMAAKDAIGQERSSGASIVAGAGLAGSDVSAEMAEMRRQIPITETWLRSYRLMADDDARSFLDLWERSRAFDRFAAARAAILAARPEGAVDGVTLEEWVTRADRVIDDLRAVEIGETQRMSALLAGELRAARRDMAGELLLFAILLMGFGATAYAMLRRVRGSIRGLIRTACHLSIEATPVPIPPCPHSDLDQIARALDVLRCAMIERRVSQEAAEALRSSVGEELDRVFAAVENGETQSRVDVLGLDAHGAVLARGVNRLLDRIEHEERRETGTG